MCPEHTIEYHAHKKSVGREVIKLLRLENVAAGFVKTSGYCGNDTGSIGARKS
jgi:hypothetical protein